MQRIHVAIYMQIFKVAEADHSDALRLTQSQNANKCGCLQIFLSLWQEDV